MENNPDQQKIQQAGTLKPEPRALPKLKNPNWLKLKKLFASKKATISNTQEHLFEFSSLVQKEELGSIITYRFQQLGAAEIRITKPETELDIKTVSATSNKKLDTTGFLMWPSEEILGMLMMARIIDAIEKVKTFKNGTFRILEIGAGYSGLAGLCLGKFLTRFYEESLVHDSGHPLVEIVITDGVDECVTKISDCINLNFPDGKMEIEQNQTVKVAAKQFNWKEYQEFEEENGTFDLIFGADVLFFRQYHQALSEALLYLLRNPQNVSSERIMLLQPNRDNTLTQFIEMFSRQSNRKLEIQDLADDQLFGDQMKKVRLNPRFEASKHDLKILTIS